MREVDITNNLIRNVYKYYPVGIMELSNSYPGTILMKEEIKAKFTAIKATRFLSDEIAISLSNAFPEKQIDNLNYFEFPSFLFEIVWENTKSESLQFTKKLCIYISLLTDYYTVYFKNYYSVKPSSTDKKNVYQYLDSFSEGDEIIKWIDQAINKTYPQKKYCSFRKLKLINFVSVYPYNFNPESLQPGKKFSAFELLFVGDEDLVKLD